MLPNKYVKIERKINLLDEDGNQKYDIEGNPLYTTSVIKSKLLVKLLEDTDFRLKNLTEYAESGLTVKTFFELTCDTFFDIKAEDLVTDLETLEEFIVIGKPYLGSLIPHVHATLQLGVK